MGQKLPKPSLSADPEQRRQRKEEKQQQRQQQRQPPAKQQPSMVTAPQSARPVTVSVPGASRPVTGRTQPASDKYPKALDLFHGVRYARALLWQRATPLRLGQPLGREERDHDDLCVYITRPTTPSSRAPLPVVVFFHGGAFSFGHPLDSDLRSFVSRSARDVLTVSVGYRLGAVGFGPGTLETGSCGALNLGLDDQAVALRWVRDWIGAFGGDAGNVTLMGVSAGAHSIGHHMLRYRSAADRPFRRVILESGSPTARSVLSASHPRTASQFADLQTRVRALGGLTRPNVTTAGSAVWARGEPSLQWPFQPVVAPGRESIIPATPLQQWSRPGLVPPPVLTGFCSHEGTTFFPGRGVPPGGLRGFFGSLIPGLDLDALERVYSRSAYPDERRRVVDAYSHHAYICPAFHTAHAASGIAGPRAKVYLYEFAAGNTPGGLASHCAHGPVLRPPGGVPIAPGLADVGAAMMGRWERFIFTPDQDGDGRPDEGMGDSWPVFRSPFTSRQAMEDPTTGLLLVFGGGNDEATGGRARGVPVSIRRMTPREMDVCRFWWDHMHLSQGMGDP